MACLDKRRQKYLIGYDHQGKQVKKLPKTSDGSVVPTKRTMIEGEVTLGDPAVADDQQAKRCWEEKTASTCIGPGLLDRQLPGQRPHLTQTCALRDISLEELAERFVAAQSANWREPCMTTAAYKQWLRVFLVDHSTLKASQFTVEHFARRKLSLKGRGYAAESINHFLSAVRAIFSFAEDAELIQKAPKLKRVRNEPKPPPGSNNKPLYSPKDIRVLIANAGPQLRAMVLLALNCGFGLKDLHDLKWEDIGGNRVTLPRSKTGVCQTYHLWPETKFSLEQIREAHAAKLAERSDKGCYRDEQGHVFMTRFRRTWSKDAISTEFRKLCRRADVPCYGIYRMRHCASTMMSMVASPHVQRRFMRHSQLQQQVTYTHVPDAEVDMAVAKVRDKLLGSDKSCADVELQTKSSCRTPLAPALER